MLNLTGGYGSDVIASCCFYKEIRLKNRRNPVEKLNKSGGKAKEIRLKNNKNSAEKQKESFWVVKGFVLEGKRTPFEE